MIEFVYESPVCELVELSASEALLSDSYYAGGGGSYQDDDIVDNGNY